LLYYPGTMKIEGKKILDKLAKEKSDRKKVTLYLSEELFEDFKESCGDIAASAVVEEMMRQFVQSVKKKK